MGASAGGGIIEGAVSGPEIDHVLYKDCMEKLGYKLNVIKVFGCCPNRFVYEQQQ